MIRTLGRVAPAESLPTASDANKTTQAISRAGQNEARRTVMVYSYFGYLRNGAGPHWRNRVA